MYGFLNFYTCSSLQKLYHIVMLTYVNNELYLTHNTFFNPVTKNVYM